MASVPSRFRSALVVSLIAISSDCTEHTFRLDVETEARALTTLREGLEDEDFWPSIHAAEGLILAGYGEVVRPRLEARLREETDDQRRCGLARELVRAGDSSKIQILADVLAGDDDYAHVHAAEGLYKIAEIGDRDTMLRAFASDENVSLHLMAAGALARVGEPGALEAIRASYSTGDESAIRIGAWLLGRIGTPDDILLLRSRLVTSTDTLVRAYIQHAMAALGDARGFEALAANLKSENPAIRTYAAAFAQDAQAVSLVPRLIEMLDDPHPDARYRAAKTLLILNGPVSAETESRE